MTTKSQNLAKEVQASIRSRADLLWFVTNEEARAEVYLAQCALNLKVTPRTWDAAAGVCSIDGKRESIGSPQIDDALAAIRSAAESGSERGLWIMRDLPAWITGPMGVVPLRALKNITRLATPVERQQTICVISPSKEVPPELSGLATVIEWPLPDREEIAEIVDRLARDYDLKLNGKRELCIDAAIGLNSVEAEAFYSKSIVQTGTIDPVAVAQEKKTVISRDGLIEWFDPLPGGLSMVGGHDTFKKWLLSRAAAFTPEARAYGLPFPKGAAIVGISGCGKSMICKALGSEWQCPLLRVDLGALKSKFVGESEGRLRRVFKLLESVGRCIVWFDEIEKALQGATSGSADGGVSSDALGAILTWMQERKGEAFVIVTANDVSQLPPEFLRKGRFDEIWFADLPTAEERVAVLQSALKTNGRPDFAKTSDFADVVAKTKDFTGAEIAALVPDAMFAAFADGKREITQADLVAAAKTIVPLSITAKEKIAALREWCKQGRARPTSADETAATANVRRLAV